MGTLIHLKMDLQRSQEAAHPSSLVVVDQSNLAVDLQACVVIVQGRQKVALQIAREVGHPSSLVEEDQSSLAVDLQTSVVTVGSR